jgi:hypothetical protein
MFFSHLYFFLSFCVINFFSYFHLSMFDLLGIQLCIVLLFRINFFNIGFVIIFKFFLFVYPSFMI